MCSELLLFQSWKKVMRNSSLLKWAQNMNKSGKERKNWIHPPENLQRGHVVYVVKFMGSVEVDEPKGFSIVRESIRKLRFNQQMRKLTDGTKLPKVELTVSIDGITIQDPKTKAIMHQYPLYRISYCADDKVDRQFISFIVKEQDIEQHTCFVFLSDKLSEEITMTIGQAFDLAYKYENPSQNGTTNAEAATTALGSTTSYTTNGSVNTLGDHDYGLSVTNGDIDQESNINNPPANPTPGAGKERLSLRPNIDHINDPPAANPAPAPGASKGKLSFRPRQMDYYKHMPIYMSEDLPDLEESIEVTRGVLQLPTGMDKDEESERHLQEAIRLHSVIPTPEVELLKDMRIYYSMYKPICKPSKNLLHMRPFAYDENEAEYDADSEDEVWLETTGRDVGITKNKFEEMIDAFDRHSLYTVVNLNDVSYLLDKENHEALNSAYDYWLSKRLKLQCNLVPQVRLEPKPGALNDPYVAFRRRKEKMQTRRNRKNDEISYESLYKLLNEMTEAQKMFNLLTAREENKQSLVKIMKNMFEERYRLNDFSGETLQEATVQFDYIPPVSLNPSSKYSLRDYQMEFCSFRPMKNPKLQPLIKFGDQKSKKKKEVRPNVQQELNLDLVKQVPEDSRYAFRRKANCDYLPPTKFFTSDYTDSVNSEDNRFCFYPTYVSRPEKKFVGFCRKRMTRGGRIALDRVLSRDDPLIEYGGNKLKTSPAFRPTSPDSTSTSDESSDGDDDKIVSGIIKPVILVENPVQDQDKMMLEVSVNDPPKRKQFRDFLGELTTYTRTSKRPATDDEDDSRAKYQKLCSTAVESDEVGCSSFKTSDLDSSLPRWKFRKMLKKSDSKPVPPPVLQTDSKPVPPPILQIDSKPVPPPILQIDSKPVPLPILQSDVCIPQVSQPQVSQSEVNISSSPKVVSKSLQIERQSLPPVPQTSAPPLPPPPPVVKVECLDSRPPSVSQQLPVQIELRPPIRPVFVIAQQPGGQMGVRTQIRPPNIVAQQIIQRAVSLPPGYVVPQPKIVRAVGAPLRPRYIISQQSASFLENASTLRQLLYSGVGGTRDLKVKINVSKTNTGERTITNIIRSTETATNTGTTTIVIPQVNRNVINVTGRNVVNGATASSVSVPQNANPVVASAVSSVQSVNLATGIIASASGGGVQSVSYRVATGTSIVNTQNVYHGISEESHTFRPVTSAPSPISQTTTFVNTNNRSLNNVQFNSVYNHVNNGNNSRFIPSSAIRELLLSTKKTSD